MRAMQAFRQDAAPMRMEFSREDFSWKKTAVGSDGTQYTLEVFPGEDYCHLARGKLKPRTIRRQFRKDVRERPFSFKIRVNAEHPDGRAERKEAVHFFYRGKASLPTYEPEIIAITRGLRPHLNPVSKREFDRKALELFRQSVNMHMPATYGYPPQVEVRPAGFAKHAISAIGRAVKRMRRNKGGNA